MADAATLAVFPNLGSDPGQIAMVATSFAAQTDFFARFAGFTGDTGLRDIAQTFALIGFLYIGFVHSAWRGMVLGPWLVVMILMTLGPSYTGTDLFFINIDPNSHAGLVSPIDPLRQFTAEELREIKKDSSSELGVLASKFRRPIDEVGSAYNLQTGLSMFAPQAAILHGLNKLRVDVGNAFFAPGQRTFQDRIVAAQTLANARTNDYRVGHIQAMFRSVCTLGNPEWERLFPTSPTQMENEYPKVYRDWANKKITLEDFLTMHLQFYAGQYELDTFVEKATETGNVSESNFGRFISPALIATDDIERLRKGAPYSGTYQSVIGLENYAGSSGRDVQTKFGEFANPETRADKELYFRNHLLQLITRNRSKQGFLNEPIGIFLPVARSDTSVSSNANGAFVSFFAGSNKITNCQEMHKYMHEVTRDLATETFTLKATAAEFATQQYNLCRANGGETCQQVDEISWGSLSETQKIYLGYQYAKATATLSKAECESILNNANDYEGNRISIIPKACSHGKIGDLSKLELALVANVLRGDQIIADGILQKAIDKDQFRSGIRSALGDIGEASAPLFIWIMSAFGGFAAGAYAAIMPLIISWGLAIMIVVTPFLYLMGLIIPGWSLMILLTPLIGILYLKSVEITFVLIKGVFDIFHQTLGLGGVLSKTGYVSGLDDPGLLGFYDLILGIAYTSSFALSLFLLFGLKNPAGLAEQVGKSADKTAQIDGKEVLQAAALGGAAALALPAAPAKAVAFAKSAQGKAGKLIAKAENLGLLDSEKAQNLTRGSQDASIARGQELAKKAEEKRRAEYFAGQRLEDFKTRASGAATNAEEKELFERFQGGNNRHAVKATPKAYKLLPDGNTVEVHQLDNAVDSLTSAVSKAAKALGQDFALDREALSRTKHAKFSRLDRDAYEDDLTVANIFKVDALTQDGGITRQNIDDAVNAGFLEYYGPNKDEVRAVEFAGFRSQSAKLGIPFGAQHTGSIQGAPQTIQAQQPQQQAPANNPQQQGAGQQQGTQNNPAQTAVPTKNNTGGSGGSGSNNNP